MQGKKEGVINKTVHPIPNVKRCAGVSCCSAIPISRCVFKHLLSHNVVMLNEVTNLHIILCQDRLQA